MKKTTALLMVLTIGLSTTFARQVVVKKEDKVKKTTTVPQKIHNTVSKHKRYSGTKVKHVTKVEQAPEERPPN